MCFFKHLVYCTFFFSLIIYLCIRKGCETLLEIGRSTLLGRAGNGVASFEAAAWSNQLMESGGLRLSRLCHGFAE